MQVDFNASTYNFYHKLIKKKKNYNLILTNDFSVSLVFILFVLYYCNSVFDIKISLDADMAIKITSTQNY